MSIHTTQGHSDHAPVCARCDGDVVTPVRDPHAVAWLGDGASTWCSQDCMVADAEQRIEAAGSAGWSV
jgi:hypothetical protein